MCMLVGESWFGDPGVRVDVGSDNRFLLVVEVGGEE